MSTSDIWVESELTILYELALRKTPKSKLDFDEISTQMGTDRTAEECEAKFEEILERFKPPVTKRVRKPNAKAAMTLKNSEEDEEDLDVDGDNSPSTSLAKKRTIRAVDRKTSSPSSSLTSTLPQSESSPTPSTRFEIEVKTPNLRPRASRTPQVATPVTKERVTQTVKAQVMKEEESSEIETSGTDPIREKHEALLKKELKLRQSLMVATPGSSKDITIREEIRNNAMDQLLILRDLQD